MIKADNNTVEQKCNFETREAWKDAVNSAPKDTWVKTRSLGGDKKSYYIPIPVQQALADLFFDEFDIIEEKYQQIENEILCTVKVSCLPSYPYSEYRTMTGTGAKPIAARSGSLIEKFPKGKITNSLEYCAPNARISAISNAIETFGNVFGRNLGRAVSTGFNFSSKKPKVAKVKKEKIKKSKK
jgi:hypothetical protein